MPYTMIVMAVFALLLGAYLGSVLKLRSTAAFIAVDFTASFLAIAFAGWALLYPAVGGIEIAQLAGILAAIVTAILTSVRWLTKRYLDPFELRLERRNARYTRIKNKRAAQH